MAACFLHNRSSLFLVDALISLVNSAIYIHDFLRLLLEPGVRCVDHHQGAALFELFLIILRLLLRHTHADEGTHHITRGSTYENSGQDAASQNRTNTRDQQGRQGTSYTADNTAGRGPREWDFPHRRCPLVITDIEFRLSLLIGLADRKTNLVLVQAHGFEIVYRLLRLRPALKHPHNHSSLNHVILFLSLQSSSSYIHTPYFLHV